MYQKKTDNVIYFVAVFMVTFVVVFMAGTTYCRVQNEKTINTHKEVKMVARIEGWKKNNKDFKIDEKKVEINIDATGSTTDVKYMVHISNIPEGVELYKDEHFLYELDNDFDGIINYKETMKEKIVFYIENNNENVPVIDDNSINNSTTDEPNNEEVPSFNVKLLFEKQDLGGI